MKRPTKEPCLKKKSAVLLSSGHFGSVAPSKILQRIQPVTHGCGAWRGGGRRSGTGNCSRGWAGSEGWGGTDPPACWVWLRWSPADAGLSRPDQITVLLKSWPTCAYSGRFLSVSIFVSPIVDNWNTSSTTPGAWLHVMDINKPVSAIWSPASKYSNSSWVISSLQSIQTLIVTTQQ